MLALLIEVKVRCKGDSQVIWLLVFLSERATCEGSTVDDERCSFMHAARAEIPHSS